MARMLFRRFLRDIKFMSAKKLGLNWICGVGGGTGSSCLVTTKYGIGRSYLLSFELLKLIIEDS